MDHAASSVRKRLSKWQTITLVTLITGYAGYYVCRSNLSVVTVLILKEFASQGITKVHIGQITTLGVFLYAIGKITHGILADFFGGRLLFLLGMALSVVCTILFGMATGFTLFCIAWGLNRYVQSMGWVALVKTASRWYPVHRHATIMALLSLSFLVGDVLSRWYLGTFIEWGYDWRSIFFISASSLACITLISFFLLRESPRDLGLPEPPSNPKNIYGKQGNQPTPTKVTDLLLPLLKSPLLWLICAMNFGLTLIRITFAQWTPLYLYEITGLSEGQAARASAYVPLLGAASAMLAGLLSDSLKGKHGIVCILCIGCMIVCLIMLSTLPIEGRPVFAVSLLGAVSFFLMAPYSYLSGVMALDLGGKQGSSTTSGISDAAGYFGAMISGYGIASIVEHYGWYTAFAFLAAIAFTTGIAATMYWLFHER